MLTKKDISNIQTQVKRVSTKNVKQVLHLYEQLKGYVGISEDQEFNIQLQYNLNEVQHKLCSLLNKLGFKIIKSSMPAAQIIEFVMLFFTPEGKKRIAKAA